MNLMPQIKPQRPAHVPRYALVPFFRMGLDLLTVHQTTYSDYELENLNIPIETLKQLAIFHNTSVDYLLGLTNVREPYPRA